MSLLTAMLSKAGGLAAQAATPGPPSFLAKLLNKSNRPSLLDEIVNRTNPRHVTNTRRPDRTFRNIADRSDEIMRRFRGVGDALPIQGEVQHTPDGKIGGRPQFFTTPNTPGLGRTPMRASIGKAEAERKTLRQFIHGKKLAESKKVVLGFGPNGLDAARSLRFKPHGNDKPAPPDPFMGGLAWFRTPARSRPRETPKDTLRPMRRDIIAELFG